jgi:RES domain-containing protein
MIVYRIAKTEAWASDLSGTGAFRAGGRWNSVGVFALYTSGNQALAMLELLVHVEESELPPDLYITTIEIDDASPLYDVPDSLLPVDWRLPENLALKNEGDKLLRNKIHIGFRVRSAVMPEEYNIVLNPQHPDFSKFVRIKKINLLDIDERLKGIS